MTMHTQPYGSVKPRTQKAHGLMDPGLFPTSPWLRGPGSMRLATKVPWEPPRSPGPMPKHTRSMS